MLRHDDLGTVHLEGPLTFDTVPLIKSQLLDVLSKAGKLYLDFQDVSFVDSAGLALLIDLSRAAAQLQSRLEYGSIPDNLMTLATLYGVSQLLQDETVMAH